MGISLTLILIILTCLISYQALNDRNMFNKLMHYPYAEARYKQYYRFLSSGFIHGSLMHLAINMYVFYIFGEAVEFYFLREFGEIMGRVNFILLYVLTIIFGDIPTYFKHRNNQAFSSVGASGAISGVLFTFIIFNPWSTLLLFFIIPCPAILAGILYLGYSTWASKNSNDRIDHDAHFYGAVFGFLFTIVLKPELFTRFIVNLQANMPF